MTVTGSPGDVLRVEYADGGLSFTIFGDGFDANVSLSPKAVAAFRREKMREIGRTLAARRSTPTEHPNG
jgi:hypothetical protein